MTAKATLVSIDIFAFYTASVRELSLLCSKEHCRGNAAHGS